LLCATGVTLSQPPKAIGGGRHLSLRLAQQNKVLRGVAFGGGEWMEELTANDGPLAVAFRPVINEYGGRRSVELHIADWRVAQPAVTT